MGMGYLEAAEEVHWREESLTPRNSQLMRRASAGGLLPSWGGAGEALQLTYLLLWPVRLAQSQEIAISHPLFLCI